MSETGKLVIVSAPSGTGKTVVTEKLIRESNSVIRSVSVTTRLPRSGEIDGVDYFFVTPAAFKKMVKENALLEWANVHGNLYGTPKQFLETEQKKGNDVILVIDVQGAKQIRETGYPAVFIFLKPPSMEELKRRLKKRGTEDEAELARRLVRAEEELKHADEYDYIVVNDDLDKTVDTLKKILQEV
ncbi:MAG: guanylate kinase [Candidatus Schekmanbacteria bacterium RBG_13_48_7]|uniref:Guanylate kinase n=1 Tax=Candidatus Schekmanbacteria bacterium RBG_13_48_7 TaxID=1817878 RepID=A0A1F7RK64_9BACT|nr:MAG: guanylate kinase [Candidatus Schekmanbacteria bacterium RBG_13_48_7]